MTQVAAVLAVRPIRRVRVFSPNEVHRNQFVDKLRSNVQVDVVAYDSVGYAAKEANIITIAARATNPILTADMVRPGTHINSLGAVVPSRAELSQNVLLRSSQIVTDSVPQAQKLSPEMIEFFASGAAGLECSQTIGTIVANRFTRGPADDVPLFKALGVGISDLSL